MTEYNKIWHNLQKNEKLKLSFFMGHSESNIVCPFLLKTPHLQEIIPFQTWRLDGKYQIQPIIKKVAII